MDKTKSAGLRREPILNVGIAGFGLSGQAFHAPFIKANPHFRLNAIATARDLAGKLYPGVRIFRSFEEMIADADIDLVILCTPNTLHFSQARMALEAGKHVIVEKPMTTSSSEARQLIEIAGGSGRKLFPFHNRRWDSDFLTVKHIIEQGYLGKVLDYECHFDRYNPEITRASWRYSQAEGGGTLFDLGIHLVDQAVSLFGKPQGVFCRLFNQRPGSVADDSFDLKLIYPGLNVTLKASVFVKEPGPRFQVHGTLGSFIKYGIDPQEASLRKGKTPGSPRFGTEAAKNRGILHSQAFGKTIRGPYETLPGNYMAYFVDVYASIVNMSEPCVKPEDALLNITIVEAAQRSHAEKRVISMDREL